MSNARAVTRNEIRPEAPRREPVLLGLICVVVAIYAWIGSSDLWQMGATRSEDAYYNLLVQGFRAGQLNLKTSVPAGLHQLADPYDPVANEPFRATLHDTSYFKGKIYLYFGVTPALVLFWPFTALTGSYLSHAQATVIFCAVGFVASAALLLALRRRYFPNADSIVAAIGLLALGLSTAVPVMLGRADVWEVPIACGYAFAMLTFGAIWQALHDEARRGRWLVAASVAGGLAVGARPTLLFGTVILLVPVAWAWRNSSQSGSARRSEGLRLVAAALAPIAAIGLGLMLYNHARFDRPWEFGQSYQLAGVTVAKQKLFSADYIGFNVRAYFFEPLRWSAEFPFAQGIKVPPLPAGHLGVEGAFGALINMPFLWLAGAALLAWRGPGATGEHAPLRWFIAAAGLFFLCCAGLLCLFAGVCDRYQVDFLPSLALLAAIGLLEWDRARNLRLALRGAAGALALFSAATNWLASYKSGPQAQTTAGNYFAVTGQLPAAIREYERALRTEPDFAHAHHGLALALARSGRRAEAIEHYRQALRSKPDFAEAHNALGVVLLEERQPAEAEREFDAALRATPHFPEAHFGRAMALLELQRGGEAVAHLEEALRLKPDFQRARKLLDFARNPNASR